MDDQDDWERRRQETIANAIALLEELFADTAVMSVAVHRKIPRKTMIRVHDQIRRATATSGVSLELRTWVSELQVACGDQGVSWIRDWPEKGNRVRHVQLLERSIPNGSVEYKVLWTSPNLFLDVSA